jgi:phage tail-like protein
MPLVQPTPVFNFLVTMWDATDSSSSLGAALLNIAGQIALGGFSECSGLNTEMELETYQEGGRNAGPHKLFKYAKYPNLVFKRGVTFNTNLADWYDSVVNHTGSSPGPLGISLSSIPFIGGPAGNPALLIRKDGMIILFDRNGLGGVGASVPAVGGLLRLPVAAWKFQGGFPERLQGPALNAKGNEVAIETLEISHQGLTRVSVDLLGGLGAVAGAVGGAFSASVSVSI